VKRGESVQAEMGRLKTVHQMIRHNMPPVAQWNPKSVESKETRLFYRVFF